MVKSIFKILTGIDVGPVRLPLRQMTSSQFDAMQKDFAAAGLCQLAQPREQ